MTNVQTMINVALAQAGDPYILGAEASLQNSNPRAFDCSELVEYAAGRAGLYMPDGAWYQYQYCKSKNTLITVQKAINTYGALLIRAKGRLYSNGGGNHIGFSLGDGRTIEARGKKYGVGIFNANRGTWTHGAYVPAGTYGAQPVPKPEPKPNPMPAPVKQLPMRKSLNYDERGRYVEIFQWELAVVSGVRFAGEEGHFGLKTARAVIDLGRVLGKNWNGTYIGPDQWAAVDFLYLSKGKEPVVA